MTHLRRFSLILAIFSIGVTQILAAPAKVADSMDAEIRAVLNAQVAAWNRGDIDGFMQGYSRAGSTRFVGGDTVTRGWQTVHDHYKRKYNDREKMGTVAFSEIQITPLGNDTALVGGRWKLTRRNDQPHGRFTLVFAHHAEGWRIIYDHTSSAEEKPAR